MLLVFTLKGMAVRVRARLQNNSLHCVFAEGLDKMMFRGVRVSGKFVCSVYLTLAGPTCAVLASTPTAVRDGRPCPGETSALSVSSPPPYIRL